MNVANVQTKIKETTQYSSAKNVQASSTLIPTQRKAFSLNAVTCDDMDNESISSVDVTLRSRREDVLNEVNGLLTR